MACFGQIHVAVAPTSIFSIHDAQPKSEMVGSRFKTSLAGARSKDH